MDSLQANYRDEDDEEDECVSDNNQHENLTDSERLLTPSEHQSENGSKPDPSSSTNPSEDETSNEPKPTSPSEEDEEDNPSPKKQKQLSSLSSPQNLDPPQSTPQQGQEEKVIIPGESKSSIEKTASRKTKKKNNNVWTKPTSRKGKKKGKASNINNHNSCAKEDTILITPIPRLPDKGDDLPETSICLSKVYKAEKVELSDDRMSAGSTKGYRMVRATRGAVEGAWYFEIKVMHLGETGHTRLGWSTDKGDLQAPVGYDANSFGYRDIDGSKIHKAVREKYGEEGYKEGDVIGVYINLPEGELYAPKPPHFVLYKGQRYVCAPNTKEDPPKVVPGSEISFFKNGVCQGTAFKDLFGGRYYPAASMYTLPNQRNCEVSSFFCRLQSWSVAAVFMMAKRTRNLTQECTEENALWCLRVEPLESTLLGLNAMNRCAVFLDVASNLFIHYKKREQLGLCTTHACCPHLTMKVYK